MDSSFPIIIMTRNDNEYLNLCVESILSTVTLSVSIYIIDNYSDDLEHKALLKHLGGAYGNINVTYNSVNLWVLGINETLRQIKEKHVGNYFFLTDGDIDFTNCKASPCWLSYLIDSMDNNMAIGKIGLSLSWEMLERTPQLKNILTQEQSLYNNARKINDFFVSAVDTTACIYRKDWSIEASGCFYPDHMRYLRPELYSCRTARDIIVTHLGWESYHHKLLSRKNINAKTFCFTIVGGDVKNEILKQADPQYRFFYKIFSKLIRRLWYIRRYYFLIKYILTKGIRLFDGQA